MIEPKIKTTASVKTGTHHAIRLCFTQTKRIADNAITNKPLEIATCVSGLFIP
jgi:hypothetical protein